MEAKMLLLANLRPESGFLKELFPEMAWDGHVSLKHEVLLRLEPSLVVTETVDPEGKAHVVLHASGAAWREVDPILSALTDLRAVFPEASRVWSEIAGVFRRLLEDLPPLDKALLSVAVGFKKA